MFSDAGTPAAASEPFARGTRPIEPEAVPPSGIADVTGQPAIHSPFRPELVVGFIGPVGCDLDSVVKETESQLHRFGYVSHDISISDSFSDLKIEPFSRLSKNLPVVDKYRDYQNAGDFLRRKMDRKDAALFPALIRILNLRLEQPRPQTLPDRGRRADDTPPAERHAFLVDSLKTPEEVTLLRRIYQDRFICIAAYTPKNDRQATLAKRIAQENHSRVNPTHEGDAGSIIDRDARGKDVDPFGQNVSDAFALADFFVDVSNPTKIGTPMIRFFDLLFGSPYITPTIEEECMYIASAAAVRSASMSRQVGAALATAKGDVVAVGTNEVPAAGGGQYWEGAKDDDREFVRGEDTSTAKRKVLVGDLLRFLLSHGWRAPESLVEQSPAGRLGRSGAAERSQDEKLQETIIENVIREMQPDREYQELMIHDILEFFREVHAEMSALLSASRNGIASKDLVLYCTTFPCHECAPHLVAAGISKVVFIEPYPKSVVEELYKDSIATEALPTYSGRKIPFQPFFGVGPARYVQLFRASRRKTPGGETVVWAPQTSSLKLPSLILAQDDSRFHAAEHISSFKREEVIRGDFAKAYSTLQEITRTGDGSKQD